MTPAAAAAQRPSCLLICRQCALCACDLHLPFLRLSCLYLVLCLCVITTTRGPRPDPRPLPVSLCPGTITTVRAATEPTFGRRAHPRRVLCRTLPSALLISSIEGERPLQPRRYEGRAGGFGPGLVHGMERPIAPTTITHFTKITRLMRKFRMRSEPSAQPPPTQHPHTLPPPPHVLECFSRAQSRPRRWKLMRSSLHRVAARQRDKFEITVGWVSMVLMVAFFVIFAFNRVLQVGDGGCR